MPRGVHVEVVEGPRRGQVVARLGGGVDHELVGAASGRGRRPPRGRGCRCRGACSARQVASRRWRFQVVSPPGPKKSARMLLSTPCTSKPRRSKYSTASDPMSPALPVTRTFTSPGRYRVPCQTPRADARRRHPRAVLAPGAGRDRPRHPRHRRGRRGARRRRAGRGQRPAPLAGAGRLAAVASTSDRSRSRGRCSTSPGSACGGRSVERATGPVDVVHSTAHVAAASHAPDGRDGPRPPLPPRARTTSFSYPGTPTQCFYSGGQPGCPRANLTSSMSCVSGSQATLQSSAIGSPPPAASSPRADSHRGQRAVGRSLDRHVVDTDHCLSRAIPIPVRHGADNRHRQLRRLQRLIVTPSTTIARIHAASTRPMVSPARDGPGP